jgi:hypothetical protein
MIPIDIPLQMALELPTTKPAVIPVSRESRTQGFLGKAAKSSILMLFAASVIVTSAAEPPAVCWDAAAA